LIEIPLAKNFAGGIFCFLKSAREMLRNAKEVEKKL
jgi:hypothetical protein